MTALEVSNELGWEIKSGFGGKHKQKGKASSNPKVALGGSRSGSQRGN